MRLKVLITFWWMLPTVIFAQSVPLDSVEKMESFELDAAIVDADKSDRGYEFSFYRSNKLANTEELLSRMSGVNLIRRGAYGMEPTLRSYGSGQTNLTIDGMRIYGACTDKMDPVSIYIEPINLQGIEVNQGASGAITGSTVGGQINLKLREPAFSPIRKNSTRFSQSFSTVNQAINSSFSVSSSSKKVTSSLSGVYRKAGDYSGGNHTEVPYSGYEKLNLNAILKVKLDSFQELKLDVLGDWGRNIGYPALPMDVGTANAQIVAITHRMMLREHGLHHNSFKLYYNSIQHSMDDTHRPEAPMHMDMPGTSQTIGFYNELMTKKDMKIRLDFHRATTFADMTMYLENEPNMYLQTLPKNTLNDLGLMVSKTYKFKKKQHVTVASRLDFTSQTSEDGIGAQLWQIFSRDITISKNQLLKNLSLVYGKTLWSRTFVQWTSAYGERLPTANERYGYYLYNRQDQYDYIGNLDLKPERSIQSELLINQSLKRFNLSLNLFYHHTMDLIYAYQMERIDPMTIGAMGVKSYQNIGFGTSKGFEMTSQAQVSKRITYMMSVKYVHAQTQDKKPLALVPPLKVQHALRYGFETYRFQLEHDYSMAQNRVNIDYGDINTSAFHLINIRASNSFRWNKSYIQTGVSVENIFDTYYREHLDIGIIPRPGRNFLFNLSLIW